jgi:hypothetical protein
MKLHMQRTQNEEDHGHRINEGCPLLWIEYATAY